jgi:hypothetical protein
VVAVDHSEVLLETAVISLSEPVFRNKGEYVTVQVEESSSLLLKTGKPVLPVVIKTFTFPIRTEIVDVRVFPEMKSYHLSEKILPGPIPVPLSTGFLSYMSAESALDESVYSSSDLYLSEPYAFQIGVGLEDNKRVVYVNVHCYPQYSPISNIIYVPTGICIETGYVPPYHPDQGVRANYYDLLIITDEKFAPQLQRLVEHKNNIGVRTILETTQNIYPAYSGRDEAEDIKLRIKDAIEQWGIRYVLLAGGRKRQTFEWYLAERRSNNNDGSGYESGYISDLYFAGIYRYKPGGLIFDDWDSNGNGVFAEIFTFRWHS